LRRPKHSTIEVVAPKEEEEEEGHHIQEDSSVDENITSHKTQ
jgi:hypothetical protein